MGRLVLTLALLLLATPRGALAASASRARAPKAAQESAPGRRAARAPRTPARAHAARAGGLAEAKAAMSAVMRDRTKRRYRHHWERAIAGLVRAARGRDAPDALLAAARARYALYRWSANEADRAEALRLAGRAAKAGSKEANGLAAAIRRAAGDDAPARPPRRRGAPQPAPEAAPESTPDEESPPDPALEAALADVAGAPAAPAMKLGESGGEGTARVTDVRAWTSEDYTRVAIYLSHWVGWQKLELPAEGDRPRRLALDLRPASLDGALARVVPGVQVDRLRAAQNDPETVRVVLDLHGSDRVELFGLEDPPRLVVDVGTHAARRAASAPVASAPDVAAPARPSATPASLEVVPESAPSGAIRRIVVDAGHGGHDPGAIGPRGVREKDVTLAIARRLATRLRTLGFEVVLTRRGDRYLPLEERTAIANTARGDLFVSVHANAHPRRSRSGVETYVLNVADDRYAARLAARENGVELAAGEGDAARILTDLDAKASAGASRRLAGLVQRELTSGVRARVGDVRDLGVKSALFYVLLGARMPAVLVETAFISNTVEERRLASPRYQDEVAGAIARAVRSFARSDARVAAAR